METVSNNGYQPMIRIYTVPRCVLATSVLFATTSVAQGYPIGIPDGYEVVDIMQGEDTFSGPRMNNCGEIVFSFGLLDLPHAEVFQYDNGKFTQITDDPDLSNVLPEINEHGSMVWTHGFDGFGSGEIVLRTTEGTSVIGVGTSGSLNDLDHVAWKLKIAETCAFEMIFFFDGTNVTEIVAGDLSNQSAQINNDDVITWTRYYFCPQTWVSDIMRFADGSVTQITPDPPVRQQVPMINSSGLIAWEAIVEDPAPSGIWTWQDGDLEFLIEEGRNPKLNDRGDM